MKKSDTHPDVPPQVPVLVGGLEENAEPGEEEDVQSEPYRLARAESKHVCKRDPSE